MWTFVKDRSATKLVKRWTKEATWKTWA